MILPSGAATQFDPAAAEQMEKIICDLGRMYHERNEALQEVARAHHESLFLLAMAADAHARQRAEQASRLEAAAQQAAGPQSGEGAAGETQASCDGGAVSQAASTVLPCQMVDGAGSLPQS